jgi:transposase
MKKSGTKKLFSAEEKEIILRWKREGMKQKEIAERCNVSKSTISYILKRYSNGDISTKKHLCGRKKLLTNQEIAVVREGVGKNRRISGPKLAEKINNNLKKTISPKTAKRYIKSNGLRACIKLREKYCRFWIK